MSELGDALRRATMPARPAAQDQTVALVRDELQGEGSTGSRKLSRLALVAAGLLLVAVSPPGQAAVSWAADLVGIGEVGGPPTNDDRPEGVTPSSEQIVIANGHAPDGTPYEVVAYRTDSPIPGEIDPGAPCIFMDFPGDGLSAGSCGSQMLDEGRSLFVSTISGPESSQDLASPVVSGYVANDVDQVDVRVAGSDSPLAAEVVRLDEATRQRLGVGQDVAFFFRFLPTGFDVRGLSTGGEQLEVTAYAAGALVDRELRGTADASSTPPDSLLDSCEEALAGGAEHGLCPELLDSYR